MQKHVEGMGYPIINIKREWFTMVEGDQELFSTLMRIFYTECGHKDVERAYTKMSWSLLRLD